MPVRNSLCGLSVRRTVLVCVVGALLACGERRAYSHFEHVDPQGWRSTDTLHFDIAGTDSVAAPHALTLCVRAADSYPYTSLTMIVTRRQHRQNVTPVADTLHIDITDSQGNILGSGHGLYEYIVSLRPAIITRGDTLHLAVTHAMSDKRLLGIGDVGVCLGDI